MTDSGPNYSQHDPFRLPDPLRPPGISELFAGVSGTGKTLAAEVLANELRLDLNRSDLSALVGPPEGGQSKVSARVELI